LSATEVKTLDTYELIGQAYEIGDMINRSVEVADYLYWKNAVHSDPDIAAKMGEFAKKKERFEECKRFGHYHPNYHEALEEVNKAQAELDRFEAVRMYKQAEQRLDDLLYDISVTIARSVSESIIVPSNKPSPGKSGCGGACSGCCG